MFEPTPAEPLAPRNSPMQITAATEGESSQSIGMRQRAACRFIATGKAHSGDRAYLNSPAALGE